MYTADIRRSFINHPFSGAVFFAKLCQEIAELQGNQAQANGARPRSSLPVRVMLKKSKHCKQDRHETILGQRTKHSPD